jgi:outer membrane receptor protein involved in Fe transport
MYLHNSRALAASRFGRSLLVGSTAMALALPLMAGTAHAQASPPTAPAKPADAAAPNTPASVGEVVVTGSRIAKKDFSANSPIVTVNSKAFENTANVSVERTLNKLPQFTPDQAELGFQTGDVQPTAIHSVGIATASLRGLGANRNLVLVDGRRLTPVNGLNIIDLNTIPSSAIDHVETISGGASAVYGADAMSGVVNFILKKNLQGLDVDAQYTNTQHGGGAEFKASALFGANFADDKGNVTLGFEHYTRAVILQQDRAFYVKGEQDPTVASNALFQFTGAQYAPSLVTGGCATDAAYRSQFGNAPAGSGLGLPPFLESDSLCINIPGALFVGTPVYFNSDGSLFSVGSGFPFNYGTWAYTNYKGPVDGTVTAPNLLENAFTSKAVQTLKRNTTLPYLSSPLNRWTFFGSAHFDISDDLTAFATGNFASAKTSTHLLPTTPINGWGVLIPYNAAIDDPASPTFNPALGHQVPASLAVLLSARGGPFPGPAVFANNPQFNEAGGGVGTSAANTPWQLNLVPDPDTTWLPPRSTEVHTTNWQLTGGVDFKVPGTDWTGEVFGSHGETVDYQVGGGNVDLDRWRAVIDAPNYGKGFSFQGNQYPLIGGGFGAGQGTCTSGLYNALFFNQRPSQDCLNAIEVTLQSTDLVAQDIVEFDAQGTLFQLPAGPLKGSLGADYRENHLVFHPDTLQDINNFADQVSGLYPVQGFDATVQAREGYGELDIPVISNQPFFKLLELQPGARYSTYTNSKAGWTYKLEGSWEVNDWIRFRGGYNLAVRAPTVAESYLALQENYGGASAWGDPCSPTTNAPYGANAALNTAGANGAKSARAICEAQMGAQGSQAYYTSQSSQPNTFNLGALWVDQIGNSNLSPEKAHTWTAGVVLKSPIASPWLQRTQLSIDWYKIKITDVIGFQSSDVVNQACYAQNVLDSAGNVDPAKVSAALASPGCKASLRSTATGAYQITAVPYVNLGMLETSGFDVQLNWGVVFDAVGMQMIPGSVNVNVLFNYLNHYLTNSGQPNAWTIDWAGTMGPAFGGVDPGAYRWKLNADVIYNVGPASIDLSWRHLPSIQPASIYLASSTHISNPNGYVSTTNVTEKTNAYNIFDLSATYTFSRRYTMRVGIDNLLDVQPPTTGATFPTPPTGYTGAAYVPSTGAGTTNPLFYDVLGRRFYVGLTAKF